MAIKTVSAVDARANFSKIGAAVAKTGESVTVFKNSKPWLVISPAEIPNDETVAAIEDTRAAAADPSTTRFSNFEDMMASLKAEVDA